MRKTRGVLLKFKPGTTLHLAGTAYIIDSVEMDASPGRSGNRVSFSAHIYDDPIAALHGHFDDWTFAADLDDMVPLAQVLTTG